MLVEVTQENINQGVVNDYQSCPIALAMQDNSLKGVEVNHWIAYTSFQLHTRIYLDVDNLIAKWIYDFDHGKGVFPIQIEINEEERYAMLVE